MTVAQLGERLGTLLTVGRETATSSETPSVDLNSVTGSILSNLSIGADVATVRSLKANALLSSRGVALHGAGFIVTQAQAAGLGLGTICDLEKHIR